MPGQRLRQRQRYPPHGLKTCCKLAGTAAPERPFPIAPATECEINQAPEDHRRQNCPELSETNVRDLAKSCPAFGKNTAKAARGEKFAGYGAYRSRDRSPKRHLGLWPKVPAGSINSARITRCRRCMRALNLKRSLHIRPKVGACFIGSPRLRLPAVASVLPIGIEKE